MKKENYILNKSHPPLDKELEKPLHEILKKLPAPLTPNLIPRSRELTVEGTLSDSEINRNGAFTFQEIEIKGYQDSIISLIICQPTSTYSPAAVIYNIHGGGMVSGNNRTAELAGELKRAEQLRLRRAVFLHMYLPLVSSGARSIQIQQLNLPHRDRI